MIVTELYKTLRNGVKLVKTYSNINHYIIQEKTRIRYTEAIDDASKGITYIESNEEIKKGIPNG